MILLTNLYVYHRCVTRSLALTHIPGNNSHHQTYWNFVIMRVSVVLSTCAKPRRAGAFVICLFVFAVVANSNSLILHCDLNFKV